MPDTERARTLPATLFVNAAQTLTAAGPARARRGKEMGDAGVREGVGVAVQGDRIVAVDADDALRAAYPDAQEVDCERGLLAPGFVDSHTHTVFGAARWAEHELRATGVPYLEIARRGGGIHSSVRDLRARTDDELFALALPRLARLAAGGVTTVEIKSGYGLSTADELRTLRVIQRLGGASAQRIVGTCLAAHEVPVERRDMPDGRERWIREIVQDIFPPWSPRVLLSLPTSFASRACLASRSPDGSWRRRHGSGTVDQAARRRTA